MRRLPISILRIGRKGQEMRGRIEKQRQKRIGYIMRYLRRGSTRILMLFIGLKTKL